MPRDRISALSCRPAALVRTACRARPLPALGGPAALSLALFWLTVAVLVSVRLQSGL